MLKHFNPKRLKMRAQNLTKGIYIYTDILMRGPFLSKSWADKEPRKSWKVIWTARRDKSPENGSGNPGSFSAHVFRAPYQLMKCFSALCHGFPKLSANFWQAFGEPCGLLTSSSPSGLSAHVALLPAMASISLAKATQKQSRFCRKRHLKSWKTTSSSSMSEWPKPGKTGEKAEGKTRLARNPKYLLVQSKGNGEEKRKNYWLLSRCPS